jgi:hypothetical protein
MKRTTLIVGAILFGLALLGCGAKSSAIARPADSFASEATSSADENRAELGQPLTVQAGALGSSAKAPLKGNIVVTFQRLEFSNGIEDRACGTGMMMPQGRWVIVYYSIKNGLNTRLQPSSQVATGLRLVDDKGRTWINDDYGGTNCFLSAQAAEEHHGIAPETVISAGFSGTTAIVFDAPADATGLAIDWKLANLRVDLGH